MTLPPADPAAPAAPPATRSQRLVLCLDGTWNNTYLWRRRTDGTKVVKPTNVLKLARAVLPVAADGTRQVVYYDAGVGAATRYPGVANRLLAEADRFLGGSAGAGFETNVEEALGFLVGNWSPGDRVYVFGFSRGAATARAVAQFLDWSGGLPEKRDAYWLPHLYRAYVVSRGERTCQQVLDGLVAPAGESGGGRRLEPFRPVVVDLLGVWDTVAALGSRLAATGWSTSVASRRFQVRDRPPRCVAVARQALAIDEARYDFRPEIWVGARDGQDLRQRWFAGVHGNVGGASVDDGLGNLALRWMTGEARALGLGFDAAFLGHYLGYAQDTLGSPGLLYRIGDWLRHRAGRGVRPLAGRPEGAHLALDPSVITRLQSDPAALGKDGGPRFPRLRTRYRPENLVAFLEGLPDPVGYLESIGAKYPELPADLR